MCNLHVSLINSAMCGYFQFQHISSTVKLEHFCHIFQMTKSETHWSVKFFINSRQNRTSTRWVQKDFFLCKQIVVYVYLWQPYLLLCICLNYVKKITATVVVLWQLHCKGNSVYLTSYYSKKYLLNTSYTMVFTFTEYQGLSDLNRSRETQNFPAIKTKDKTKYSTFQFKNPSRKLGFSTKKP